MTDLDSILSDLLSEEYDIRDKELNTGKYPTERVRIINAAKSKLEKLILGARIEQLEDIIDHYQPYRPILDSPEAQQVREFCSDRINSLREGKDV